MEAVPRSFLSCNRESPQVQQLTAESGAAAFLLWQENGCGQKIRVVVAYECGVPLAAVIPDRIDCGLVVAHSSEQDGADIAF